jgi:hypothetical protein
MIKMKKILFIFLALFFLTNLSVGSCATDPAVFHFDDKTYYDIYLYGNRKAVISHVKIVKQIEIKQTTFLVIEPSDFNLDNSQGYVNLDTVSAILPSMKFRVEDTDNIIFYHPNENKK